MISVTLSDGTTSISGAIIRVMSGTPGSGTLPVKIDSAIGPGLNYVDQSLGHFATGYYYIDVSIGSARIVTAPIWYTRNDASGAALPVILGSFTAQKQNTKSLLKWTTVQELNTREFVAERSTNGSTWEAIATVAANGNSTSPLNYSVIDQNPAKSNFYRLKIIDIDNKFDYSSIRRVNFDRMYTYSIYPNPVRKVLQITVDAVAGLNANVQVLNIQSQELINKRFNTAGQLIQLDVSALSSGIYFLKIISADGIVTIQKFVRE